MTPEEYADKIVEVGLFGNHPFRGDPDLRQRALKRTNPCGVPANYRRRWKDGTIQACRRGT